MNPSVPTIADLIDSARDYVRRATQLELDMSVESLAFVDHYLRQAGAVSDELLVLLAPAVGAYFAEVVLAHLGGSWHRRGNPDEWTVTLAAAPITFNPAGLAAEAFRQDAVAGYDGTVRVPPDLEEALTQVLAAAAPVTKSYYYSLTGRLETLEHMSDILVELRRRQFESRS